MKTGLNGNRIQQITYVYDVFGDLLTETTNQYTSGTLTSTTILGHSYVIRDISPERNPTVNTELAQLDGSGNIVLRYLTATSGMILAQTTFATGGQGVGTGAVEWLLQDRIGNIREVLDASGNLLDSITYDAFGNITSQTNATYQPNYLFGEMRFDVATGLYFAHWRVYNPVNGQWMQEDPLKFTANDTNLVTVHGVV